MVLKNDEFRQGCVRGVNGAQAHGHDAWPAKGRIPARFGALPLAGFA